jgi:hypothetical protein
MKLETASNDDLMLYMAYIIDKLCDFKYKCYEKQNIDIDWLMKNAPCNIDEYEILHQVLNRITHNEFLSGTSTISGQLKAVGEYLFGGKEDEIVDR